MLIQTQKDLDRLDWKTDIVGIDHEFDWRDTYGPIPSLVQLATQDRVVAIDLLVGLDLTSLRELLKNPNVTFVCHDASSELPLIQEVFDTIPYNLVDTQLASGFLGSTKVESFGSLVAEYCGITLDKSKQTSPWLNRPLSKAQLQYALNDAKYLPLLWTEIQKQFGSDERESWFQEELQLQKSGIQSKAKYLYTHMGVKNRGAFEPIHYSLLRELFDWREKFAKRVDRPRGWIVRDTVLVQLATLGDCQVGTFIRTLKNLDLHKRLNELRKVFIAWERRTDDVAQFLKLGGKSRERLVQDLRQARDLQGTEHNIYLDLIFRRKQAVELFEDFVTTGEFPAWFGTWRDTLVGEQFRSILSAYAEEVNAP
ncbi:MAG: HRDC domain-containing protein [Gammaproteobacteria bacterium]|nr:HRDC domain-containing protein [Gammaproteobacteria bacterium]